MKKAIIKLVALILVFVFTIAGYFLFTIENGKKDDELMTTATLPIVSMTYNQNDINTLHGYIVEMNGVYMRDSITPLMEGRKVCIKTSKLIRDTSNHIVIHINTDTNFSTLHKWSNRISHINSVHFHYISM